MDKKTRWAALDALRGLAVFVMIPVNAGMDFPAFPAWMKHAPGQGMTLADFVMPAFLFAMGLSQATSLSRRLEREGPARTAGHAVLRNLLLFGFGTIGFFLVWRGQSWEILQMLGLAGILAFPFLFLPSGWRALAVLLAAGCIESLRPALLEPAFRAWYASGTGGPLGALPLATLVIAASVVGEDLAERPPCFRAVAAAAAGVFITGAGFAFTRWVPVDKHLLSLSYLLIASGAASLALALLELASAALARSRRKGAGKGLGGGSRRDRDGTAVSADLPLLGALGRNALLAYMGGGVLTLAVRAFVPAGAGTGTAWAASLGTLAAMSIVTIVMDRRGAYLKL